MFATTIAVATWSLFLIEQSSGQTATASFNPDNTGVSGIVSVSNGRVTVDLDLSRLNMTELPDNCTVGGMRYHIHEKWNHTDLEDYLLSGCSSMYTGGHWDPWLACSSSTGNKYCEIYSSNNYSCVPSSITWNDNSVYHCNSSVYKKDPYSCEVGDWSGKYGYLQVNSTQNITQQLSASVASAFEVDSTDLVDKSIVFHCNDNTRAFCAPFVLSNDTTASDDRLTQNSTSKIADFSELLGTGNQIVLNTDGKYEINLDLTTLNLNSSECGTEVLYRVYTEYTVTGSGTSTADCYMHVGNFYDPTVSCNDESEYNNQQVCSENEATPIENDLDLCGDTNYTYSCNYTDKTNPQRFDCAPGDLSGKYGVLDISGDNRVFQLNGTDDLLISLDTLGSRSIVLICPDDDNNVVACAEIQELSSGSKSKNKSSNTWWIIVLVVVGVIIAGIIIFVVYKKCSGKGAYQKL